MDVASLYAHYPYQEVKKIRTLLTYVSDLGIVLENMIDSEQWVVNILLDGKIRGIVIHLDRQEKEGEKRKGQRREKGGQRCTGYTGYQSRQLQDHGPATSEHRKRQHDDRSDNSHLDKKKRKGNPKMSQGSLYA